MEMHERLGEQSTKVYLGQVFIGRLTSWSNTPEVRFHYSTYAPGLLYKDFRDYDSFVRWLENQVNPFGGDSINIVTG